jgi:putative oxidoreductase
VFPTLWRISYSAQTENLLQRLFSTFASGWPGVGLLLQRVLTGTVLVVCMVATFTKTFQFALVAPSIVGAAAGVLLLLGLCTPVAGTLVAAVEMWVSLSHAGNPLTSMMLAVLGATLAMIGPGAWSIDARLFGRKHIDTA